MNPEVVHEVRAALLALYSAKGRDLPWRRTRDPYAIWISEVMAQQTRIDTVVPYYERWLRRFPDVETLAAAPVDDVLKEWEGLGYYSRARNLHGAARVVCERHAGALPDSYAALRELPGVGDYTAGAIASIAFGAAEPAVDGNVRRVLSRLLDDPDPAPATLRATAASLLPHDRPGEFNQALMEFGATICVPRSPRCGECPLTRHCAAFRAGTQAQRPSVRTRSRLPTYEMVTVVLRREDGRVLLQRRPLNGLLAGLWAFPARELRPGEDATTAALDLASGLTGTAHSAAEPVGEVLHVFSHRRERYRCLAVDLRGETREIEGEWIGSDRSSLTLPRAQQKIHELVFRRSS